MLKTIVYSDQSITNGWTEYDTISLIYIVNKVGRHWIMIADKYKSHLKNKNAGFLQVKYWNLKQNQNIFEKLKEKAKLVKHIKIDYAFYTRRERVIWSKKETTYLVLGVMKNGSRWNRTFRINIYYTV